VTLFVAGFLFKCHILFKYSKIRKTSKRKLKPWWQWMCKVFSRTFSQIPHLFVPRHAEKRVRVADMSWYVFFPPTNTAFCRTVKRYELSVDRENHFHSEGFHSKYWNNTLSKERWEDDVRVFLWMLFSRRYSPAHLCLESKTLSSKPAQVL